ncbi:MAG: serine/threonine protein kinase [Candidatus Obscuribacterales bacterium]|nr:serine/threonine protein kinase [Candidatus Obscuribacterales bacterium]
MKDSEPSVSYVEFDDLSPDKSSLSSNTATPEVADAAGDDLSGTLFADKYMVLHKLGEGGVGTVYKVRHVHLDRTFALKVLQGSHSRGDAVLRFQQEAKVVSSLNHPNIVKITDFGISGDGRPYMVMDLLEGLPLSVFRQKTEPSTARLARIFRQVCEGLAYAHEHAIVHRDVKPGNIVVRTDESGVDHVTVVDFGIAKVQPNEDSREMNLTRTGDVFGTPLYMSPEQCLGHSVDSRADIYSLGCVMYEAYAGLAPFRGESLFQVVNQQIHDTPPAISKPNRTRSDRRFEAVILKAMAKLPQDRYRFAVEMATELKMVEIAESDIVSDFQLFIKMSQGRSRAGSKRKALWDMGAQGAMALSVICVLILITFPTLTRIEIKRMSRNELLLGHLEDAIGGRAQKNSKLYDTLNIFSKNIANIEPLCKFDPKQKEIYDQLKIQAPQADRATHKIVVKLNKLFDENEMLSLSDGFGDLNKVINRWLACAAIYSDLRSYTFEQWEHQRFLIAVMIPLFESAKWTGVALLLFFATFLTSRFKKYKKRKSAGLD